MTRMIRVAAAAALLTFAAGCRSGPPAESALLRYWGIHASEPRDYLVGKFSKHDWVFLGEYHRVKHDLDLVASTAERTSTSIRSMGSSTA